VRGYGIGRYSHAAIIDGISHALALAVRKIFGTVHMVHVGPPMIQVVNQAWTGNGNRKDSCKSSTPAFILTGTVTPGVFLATHGVSLSEKLWLQKRETYVKLCFWLQTMMANIFLQSVIGFY
jgi:hypothetical protein